ncbi:transposase [Collinsella aerofaciens]|uniref:transposase n=1 Tax=Collinsella aerofaciens TaxID=74426 RepID=UPI003982F6E0
MPFYEALSPQRDISHNSARRHTADGRFSIQSNARSFAAWVGLTPSEHSSGESDRRGAITKAGNKHLRKALVEAAWHYLTCSGRPKEPARGQAPDPGARRHAAKGVRRLVERREALLARGVHNNKANVATARELACWVWAVGLMAEEA